MRWDGGFSALQRAEIAEILRFFDANVTTTSFSALQRAEIAEIIRHLTARASSSRFSALQRAEIAEMLVPDRTRRVRVRVSVLFNEPKLLK